MTPSPVTELSPPPFAHEERRPPTPRIQKSGGAWKRLLLLILGVGGIATITALSVKARADRQTQQVEQFAKRSGVRPVMITTPHPIGRSELELPGNIVPAQQAEVFPRVSGYVKDWYFDIGHGRVKQGTILCEIDTPELDLELIQAEAALKQAEAETSQTKAEKVEINADIDLAKANVVKSEALLEQARSSYARSESLANTKSVSRQDLDDSLQMRDSRAAELAAAKAELRRKEAALITHAATVASKEAVADTRKAAVNRLKQMQSFKQVRAPFDGSVSRRLAERGQLVNATGQGTMLYLIAQKHLVKAQIYVPQNFIRSIKPGDPVEILLPERPGEGLKTTITRQSGAADSQSRTVLVEIDIDNAKYKYYPGTFCNVRFQTVRSGAVCAVPANTLLMRSEGPHVVVVKGDDSLLLQPVVLGRDIGKEAEIVSGLSGQERLVVNPNDAMFTGMKVEVIQSEKKD